MIFHLFSAGSAARETGMNGAKQTPPLELAARYFDLHYGDAHILAVALIDAHIEIIRLQGLLSEAYDRGVIAGKEHRD
jgi:hypothetical protein